MDSWLNMMLLCGLLLIASLQTSNAFRLRRSKNDKSQLLRPHIDNLRRHYNTLGTEWVGKYVFASHLEQLNSKPSCTCQTLLLEGMLNFYEDLFQGMLNKADKKENEKLKEVTTDLNEVLNEVKKLRRKYSEDHKVWRELQEIHSFKMKNETIQGGALNDFTTVFNRAYTEKHDKVQ